MLVQSGRAFGLDIRRLQLTLMRLAEQGFYLPLEVINHILGRLVGLFSAARWTGENQWRQEYGFYRFHWPYRGPVNKPFWHWSWGRELTSGEWYGWRRRIGGQSRHPDIPSTGSYSWRNDREGGVLVRQFGPGHFVYKSINQIAEFVDRRRPPPPRPPTPDDDEDDAPRYPVSYLDRII